VLSPTAEDGGPPDGTQMSKRNEPGSKTEELSRGRNLRKRVLAGQVDDAPNQQTPCKIQKASRLSSEELDQASKGKLSSISSVVAKPGMTNGFNGPSHELSKKDLALESKIKSSFEMTVSENSMEAGEFNTFIQRQTCYCLKDEGVFACEKSLKLEMNWKPFCQVYF